MKIIAQLSSLVIFVLLLAANFASAQNFNWITPGRTYLKMYLADDGMYRINRNDFANAGINTSTIDPRTVKVINRGIQIPIYFSGEQDGTFDAGDYLDFYGTRNYGGITNTYESNNSISYVTNEYYNFYSDTNVYWVDWGGSNGMRYANSNYSTSVSYPLNYFYDTLHVEKDKIYSQGEHASDVDFRFLNVEKFRGESWYWTLLPSYGSLDDTFTVRNLNSLAATSSVRIFAYPQRQTTSLPNEHSIEIRINNNLITTLFTDNFKRIDTTVTFPTSLLTGTSDNFISLKYVPAPGFDGAMYIDLYEISYPRKFELYQKQASIDLTSADTTSKRMNIAGYTSASLLNIFDVNNSLRITNFTNNLDTLKFTGKSNGKFEIVNDTIRKKPFRIKQRVVTDLTSASNGADYLIIYNSIFQQQAEQLRAYRQSRDNFRSFKAEIEDIYDIFGYGLENPAAVRYFTKYVRDNWQTPQLQYICLFGRGSLDPKMNSASSVYYQNYVPVYGFPNSDSYFANFNIGSFFYYQQVAVGRLPAYYPSEAQAMVDKIIAYENEKPDYWGKTVTFITGGTTYPEQQQYQGVSNFECNFFITPKPVCGECAKVYRSDTSGHITYNYADSIKNTIDRGTSIVSFRGHAGSHDWEIGMHDPSVLNNGNKLPVILSLTCFTGENAQGAFRGFGEKFTYLQGKGSIGFVATTGWSYVTQGNDFGAYILQSMKIDSIRRLGDLVKSADKIMSGDSASFNTRHTINCYGLSGDPAVKLILPKIPEFSITQNDYKLHDDALLFNEPITLSIYPKNFGLSADSTKIRFQLIRNNQNFTFHDTVYKSFRFKDTVLYRFEIDSPGVYKMLININQDNWYPGEDPANNSIVINLPVKQNLFSPISPIDNSVLFKDSVEFSALNPFIDFNQNSVRVIMQLDTTNQFNSPIARTFTNNNPSGTVTKFRTNVPLTVNNTVYYWRTNSTVNNDTSGWSKTQKFIFNNGVRLDESKERYINSVTPVVLSKSEPGQFSEAELQSVVYENDGFRLNEYPANLFVRSFGSNGEEASYFAVGNRNIYIDGGMNRGLNLLKVKKVSGKILGLQNVMMTSQTGSNDTLLNYLNTFDSTHYLMLLNASYVPGGCSLSVPVRNKLHEFGSIYCDSIGLLGYFHTWSLIGFLGATPSQASEMFDPCCRPVPNCVSCNGHWAQSTSSMDVIFKETTGYIQNIIGPAESWQDFSWKQQTVANSTLSFDIIGIEPSGQQTVLRSNVTTNTFTDLTSIDAIQYPRLNLLAKFYIDSLTGTQSPYLNSINVNYSPSQELILDKNSLQVNSIASQAGLVNYSFSYRNAGYIFVNDIIVNVFDKSISDSNLISTDTVDVILKTDSTLTYSGSFSSPRFIDSTRIYIQLKPKEKYSEYYEFNNSADFRLETASLRGIAAIEVLSDGKKIGNGDYISKNPELKVSVTGTQSSVPLTEDTTQLMILLNNKYIPLYMKGGMNPAIRLLHSDAAGNETGISLLFYPVMENGKNDFSVIYKNGAAAYDTVSYDVIVSEDLIVQNIFNYPNPMNTETKFIFNVAGGTSTEKMKIKIYSVSGRIVKQIDAFATIGINSVTWDGRDEDGDFVANGTYFYRLVTENESFSETPVQKLVILK